MDFSPKQIDSFNNTNAKINIWEGAVRSGKTYVSLWRFLKEIKQGPSGQFVVIAKSIGSFKRNVYEQLQKIIGTDVHWYSGKQEMFIWGRQIHVIGASDERSESRIKGPTFMGAYVDEATEIPEAAWKMLVSRCAMGGAKIFATTNPDTPFHYLKTEFLDNNPDVKSYKFFLEDNPALTKADQDYLRRQYKGLWHKRYILAEWCLAEGSIFDFFDESINVIREPPSYAKYNIIGVDYGTKNPCAFVMLGFNDDAKPEIWAQKEYYFDSEKAGYQKTDAEYADDFMDFMSDHPIKAIYIDPSAASFKQELRRRRTGLPIKDANNDVRNGIGVVSMRLALGNFKVCKSCPNLIQEIQSYVWDSKKALKGVEEPVKSRDHAIDACRYALMTHWGDKRELREQSAEEREFELWKKQKQANSPWAPPRPQGRVQILRPK